MPRRVAPLTAATRRSELHILAAAQSRIPAPGYRSVAAAAGIRFSTLAWRPAGPPNVECQPEDRPVTDTRDRPNSRLEMSPAEG